MNWAKPAAAEDAYTIPALASRKTTWIKDIIMRLRA